MRVLHNQYKAKLLERGTFAAFMHAVVFVYRKWHRGGVMQPDKSTTMLTPGAPRDPAPAYWPNPVSVTSSQE